MHIRSGFFQPQLEKIMRSLPLLKEDRPHGPKAVLSDHDTSATTGTIKHIHEWLAHWQNDLAILWLTVELSDVHAVSAFPYIIPYLWVISKAGSLGANICYLVPRFSSFVNSTTILTCSETVADSLRWSRPSRLLSILLILLCQRWWTFCKNLLWAFSPSCIKLATNVK